MPIPTRLDGWTPDAILGVLRERSGNEGDTYEFKESVNSKDPAHADQLRRAAASLANTGGGFLIFGVRATGSPEERLVGMEPSGEYSKELSDKIRAVEPALNFEPAFHPLPDGKVVLVAEVPAAARGPHSCDVKGARYFWRRSQGTATAMTHQEIREAFSNYEERRARIEVVYVSLAMNWVRIREMAKMAEADKPSTSAPDMSQIRLHLGDVHGLCPEAVRPLFAVLNAADLLSTLSALVLEAANRPLYNDDQRRVIRDHCRAIVTHAQEIRLPIEESMALLRDRFDFSSVSTNRGEIPPILYD